MNIRQAVMEDHLLLSTLSMDVQRLHAEAHPSVFKMPPNNDYAASFFQEMLVDPTVTIFIAEDHLNAVGYILCKLVERPDNPFTFPARILLVDQISVAPEARGKGIGAALLKQAELLGRELKADRIVLDSWDFNIKAHAFFERLGFRKFMYRFWRHI
jgi:ribosomal protein S18 acetylase RimI-like enzyme